MCIRQYNLAQGTYSREKNLQCRRRELKVQERSYI